ncbi:MAG: hypothetical protein DMF75_19930 [Acidobacteria bacterium]|nr:MAG: hypothetical protein DMF75_19930 [Acidobacteriota bacterium]
MNTLTRVFCRALIATTAIVFTSFAANAQAPDAKTKATGSISGRVTIGGKAAEGISVAAFGGENFDGIISKLWPFLFWREQEHYSGRERDG